MTLPSAGVTRWKWLNLKNMFSQWPGRVVATALWTHDLLHSQEKTYAAQRSRYTWECAFRNSPHARQYTIPTALRYSENKVGWDVCNQYPGMQELLNNMALSKDVRQLFWTCLTPWGVATLRQCQVQESVGYAAPPLTKLEPYYSPYCTLFWVAFHIAPQVINNSHRQFWWVSPYALPGDSTHC